MIDVYWWTPHVENPGINQHCRTKWVLFAKCKKGQNVERWCLKFSLKEPSLLFLPDSMYFLLIPHLRRLFISSWLRNDITTIPYYFMQPQIQEWGADTWLHWIVVSCTNAFAPPVTLPGKQSVTRALWNILVEVCCSVLVVCDLKQSEGHLLNVGLCYHVIRQRLFVL